MLAASVKASAVPTIRSSETNANLLMPLKVESDAFFRMRLEVAREPV
jgi:hypothetical protein